MCLLKTNATIDKQLESLGGSDKEMIEKRLRQFAFEANVTQQGGLDNPAHIWKRRPQTLKDANARKVQIGRHRVYYTGTHKDCFYFAFFIKRFKKSRVDDEDESAHQNKLIRAVNESVEKIQEPPKSTDLSSNDAD